MLPTVAVRDSFLAGEHAACARDGTSPSWLDSVEADFEAHAARCREPWQVWGVPTTEYWYVNGPVYYGGITIRHHLTPELRREGGHIGYLVVPVYRRRGHATAMLAGACTICYQQGMTELLLTCGQDNTGSGRADRGQRRRPGGRNRGHLPLLDTPLPQHMIMAGLGSPPGNRPVPWQDRPLTWVRFRRPGFSRPDTTRLRTGRGLSGLRPHELDGQRCQRDRYPAHAVQSRRQQEPPHPEGALPETKPPATPPRNSSSQPCRNHERPHRRSTLNAGG